MNAELSEAERAATTAGLAVSRETLERLALYVDLLKRWNPAKNLVSPPTLAAVWTRHIADCLQLAALMPQARLWIDLGSGGGLPGLILAAVLAERPGGHVHCVESKLGKAAFLREAARVMAVPVTVHARRIEDFTADWSGPVDAVTARALAPMAELIRLAYPLLKTGAVGLFPKGQDVVAELTEASRYWKINYELTPSATDSRGRIVTLRSAEPLSS